MYTLADFARIEKTYRDVLPLSVKQQIQAMCKSVGAQPVFTVMVQSKSSIQDAIREINKLTDTNCDIQTPLILDIVAQVDLRAFADVFFMMVGKNAFCSKTYATLFAQLQSRWALFTEIFEIKYKEYVESFQYIVSVDPEDYDAFCDWKAANDKRRTFTLFLIHATELRAIPATFYTDTVQLIMDRIHSLMDQPNKDQMNEMVENLYLLKPREEKWTSQIHQWTTMKPADHLGFSYKIIFRLMDVLKN
jgi:hypothetical protein